MIPFFALVSYKRHPPAIKQSNKFDPRGEEGLFIGWHFNPGFGFHGDHLVVPLAPFLEDLDAAPNVIRTRDISILDGPFVFPLRLVRVPPHSLACCTSIAVAVLMGQCVALMSCPPSSALALFLL